MWQPKDNLISAEQLNSRIEDSDLVVVDSRSDLKDRQLGYNQYLASHIPGAVFVSVDDDLADTPGVRGRHPLPPKDRFVDLVCKLGISNDSHVVVYDAGNSMFACRLWWMMRWVGHERVSVLDGGFDAWQAGGFAVSTDIPPAVRCTFETREPLTRTVTAEQVASHIGILLDARTSDRFHGENELMDHTAGHIPGAICSPFLDNIGPSGKFTRDPAKFSMVSKDADVICYCGSGVTATNNILALVVAGYGEPALYPGSWSEWIENSDRAIAT